MASLSMQSIAPHTFLLILWSSHGWVSHQRSEYSSNLSEEARNRHESKIAVTGLAVDPYTNDDTEWTPQLETNPQLWWR